MEGIFSFYFPFYGLLGFTPPPCWEGPQFVFFTLSISAAIVIVVLSFVSLVVAVVVVVVAVTVF